MTRGNDEWIAQLSSQSAEREAALSELRDALVRNLRKALAHRPHVDDALLDDTAQEALLRILDRLDQFQGRSRFLTWATTIAIRVAFDELRRKRWSDVSLDQVMADTGMAPGRSSAPSVQSERQALLEAMYGLIETELTEKQRNALLAELKGMPQDEIARHLGSNRNAIYKLTHDARRKLKRGLEKAGYTAAEVVAVTGS